MKIAYFGHDLHDAAIAKRVRSLQAAGHEVTGFMMRRGKLIDRPWRNIDLGRTHNGAYLHRVSSIWQGVRLALANREYLLEADVVIARNLDMMICASIACNRAMVAAPLIYECLDVHHLLTRPGPAGSVLRRIEGALLRQSRLLVVSSPAFETEYFARHFAGLYEHMLVENRLAADAIPPRPERRELHGDVLRIGWFGVLRCARSLALLSALAREMNGTLEVITAGKPVIDGFHETIDATPHMTYRGPYRAPEDLPMLYGDVDVVWAGDFYQADFNSRALLPNRIYEGGYFGVPAIAPQGTQTAIWLRDHGTGFALDEPLEETLPGLVRSFIADPSTLEQAMAHVASLPREVFVEPDGLIDDMLNTALGRHGTQRRVA